MVELMCDLSGYYSFSAQVSYISEGLWWVIDVCSFYIMNHYLFYILSLSIYYHIFTYIITDCAVFNHLV